MRFLLLFFFSLALAFAQTFTLRDVLELSGKKYVIAPMLPPGTLYITSRGIVQSARTSYSFVNNANVVSGELDKNIYEDVEAIIEILPAPTDYVIEANFTDPDVLLKLFEEYAVIEERGGLIVVRQKARLRFITGEEMVGTPSELYKIALKKIKENKEQKLATVLLYPLISGSDFATLCAYIKAECYPLTTNFLVKATEEGLKTLLQYARLKRPRYNITAYIVILTERAKKELSLSLNIDFSKAGLVPFVKGSVGVGEGVSAGVSLQGGLFALKTMLKALQEKGQAQILSEPAVVVDDRERAVIKTGFQIPVITPGTAQTPPLASFKDAVLSLSVEPITLPDGTIRAVITITKDAPDFTNKVGENIPIITNQLTTTITTEVGKLIVIGGTIESVYTKEVKSLPLLSWLLGSRSTDTQTKQLYIFLQMETG